MCVCARGVELSREGAGGKRPAHGEDGGYNARRDNHRGIVSIAQQRARRDNNALICLYCLFPCVCGKITRVALIFPEWRVFLMVGPGISGLV